MAGVAAVAPGLGAACRAAAGLPAEEPAGGAVEAVSEVLSRGVCVAAAGLAVGGFGVAGVAAVALGAAGSAAADRDEADLAAAGPASDALGVGGVEAVAP